VSICYTLPMPEPTPEDHQLAHRLATEAGELLVELRARRHAEGADPKAMKDEGDALANELLLARLAEHAPGDGILSEESRVTHGDEGRLAAERVWIIDPLDGTREFGEVPRTDWAVHVALVIGGRPVCGAVALPALGVTLSTAAPPAPLPPVDPSPRVVVSRTRPPAEAETVRAALDGQLVEMGSAGAKTMAILQGLVDVYPHSGGQYEWDSCAPVAVALAAGLHVSRIDGSPCVYNQADPYMPDLLICRPEYAEAVLKAVAALPVEAPAA
jgi:3'(2'), 5'-bisphosphate nucleotidase